MKNFFFLILGLVIIIGSAFLFLEKRLVQENLTKIVKINETSILAEIADIPEARALGLSGREALTDNTGMLFIFDQPAKYGFWMKDMNFAIDIVWINEELYVIGVEKNVSPKTFPQIFHPDQAVKYVLELPAGFADEYRIDIGQYATI